MDNDLVLHPIRTPMLQCWLIYKKMSPSGGIMATFFAVFRSGLMSIISLIVGAAMVLGEGDMAIITGWLSDPFFP